MLKLAKAQSLSAAVAEAGLSVEVIELDMCFDASATPTTGPC